VDGKDLLKALILEVVVDHPKIIMVGLVMDLLVVPVPVEHIIGIVDCGIVLTVIIIC